MAHSLRASTLFLAALAVGVTVGSGGLLEPSVAAAQSLGCVATLPDGTPNNSPQARNPVECTPAAQACTVRYYLSPIVGSGTSDDPLHSRVAAYDASVVSLMPSNPATGSPRSAWTLSAVGAANHSWLLRDPQLGALPDVPLDTHLSDLDARAAASLRASLARFQIDRSVLDSAYTYRDVLVYLARLLEPAYNAPPAAPYCGGGTGQPDAGPMALPRR